MSDAPRDLLLDRMPVDDPFAAARELQSLAAEGDPWRGQACALATADAAGRPSVRFVLAKSIQAEGVDIFTNYGSRKAQELDANPHAALAFHWPQLGVQLRLAGSVRRSPAEASDAYFATRPRASQLGAWASRQSEAIAPNTSLQEKLDTFQKKFVNTAIDRPDFWGGFRLEPTELELWFEGEARLHRRWNYEKTAEGSWQSRALFP